MRVPIRELVTARQESHRLDAPTRGQSFVEFALILPVFLLVVLIGLDFGRAYIGYVGLQQTTRIAANFASIHAEAWTNPTDQTVIDKYRALIINDSSTTNCVLPAENKLPDPEFSGGLTIGSPAVVNLTCTFKTLTPFIQAILPQNVKISARSTFPIRKGAFVGAPSTGPKPGAYFLCIPTSGTVPLSINCTDNSTQSPSAWLWDWGDGTTPSTEQNPYDSACSCSHQYTTDGTYTLSLTATNVNGSSAPKTATITVNPLNPGPVADFTWSPSSITAGSTTVQFTDTSANTPTSWAWDFDGNLTTDSTLQNPTHLYSSAGTYTVTLTATNANGSNAKSKTLTVNSPPNCGPVPNFVGLTVHTDTLASFQTSWNAAGFTTTIFWDPSTGFYAHGSHTVTVQSVPANTFKACNISITLTWT